MLSAKSFLPDGADTLTGKDLYAYAKQHAGTKVLHRFNANLAVGELPKEKLKIFFASMTAFVRHITPGIPALASRLTDELYEELPYRAHGIAAHILDAAIDEYGLSGTKPHAELLRDFALHFDLPEADLNAPGNAGPSSRMLGQKMFEWYRTAPVDYALGMHTASEVTGYQEAFGFYDAFLTPPKYGLTKDTPAFTYVATHVENEGDHSSDVVICLDAYLEVKPASHDRILQGCRAYMALYETMFDEMNEAIFGDSEPAA